MQDTQKRKKIMFAITKGVWGGAQEYVFTLATSLPEDKYDVVVVCGEGETLQKNLTVRTIRTITIETLKRNISFVSEIKSFFNLLRIIKNEKPDVLHLNSSKMGLLGGIAGRIYKVPKIIFTCHGWAFNESRPFIVRKVFLLLQWITVALSHITIAVSRKTKNDIEDLEFIRKKVFVIHNGIGKINFEEKNSARNKFAEITNTYPKEIIIGTISELHKNKGLDYLISACKNLPLNVSVYIIGEGDEKDNLLEQTKKLGLQNKIHFTGRIDNIKTLLKAFDIFTLTSRTEALPYTILEAGMAGCSVIASRVGGIPEIIENGKSGIVIKSGDISEISRALKYLIDKPQKRDEFGQSLKMTVEKEFSQDRMVSDTEKFY